MLMGEAFFELTVGAFLLDLVSLSSWKKKKAARGRKTVY